MTPKYRKELQHQRRHYKDLQKLYQWSVDWQMLFNTTKSKAMHFRQRNMKYDFMGIHMLDCANQEKDLGVYITDTLQPSVHIANIVKKANQISGMINRTYTDKCKGIEYVYFTCTITKTFEQVDQVLHCINLFFRHLPNPG